MRPGDVHRARLIAVAVAVLACGCGDDAVVVQLEVATLVRDGVEVSADAPTVEPGSALVGATRRGPARWVLEVEVPDEGLVVRSAEACPHESSATELRDTPTVELVPMFEISGERGQVGFGETFELALSPGCELAESATIEWEPEGPAIEDLAVEENGRVLRGRMPGLAEALGGEPAPGLVALSPRTRGTRTLVLRASANGSELLERRVAIHAAGRTTGVPSVPIGTRVYFGGDDWTMSLSPPRSHPRFEPARGVSTFVADTAGRYVFVDPEGIGFSIAAGTHRDTPLDCGRAECHASATDTAATSPMTTFLARNLENPEYTPGCAPGCHSAGEQGLPDGGLSHEAALLGRALPARGERGAWEQLPRELRRLGGVGCTTCHGPGAIPEPTASERILRTDVCATCHDAPPRYGHVAAWQGSRMARSDAHDGIADRPECARCHSTAAFLRSEAPEPEASADGDDAPTGGMGAPRPASDARGPDPGPTGIACAACHAPHVADPAPRLIRVPRIPPLLADADTTLTQPENRICVACHTPEPARTLPVASAAALLGGVGAFDASGGALRVEAPHANLDRGCMACHGTAPVEGLERGTNHRFGVDPAVCTTCHDAKPEPALAERVAEIAARLADVDVWMSRSASEAAAPETPAARARWNVALVGQDRGAWAHGGASTESILDAAEALSQR